MRLLFFLVMNMLNLLFVLADLFMFQLLLKVIYNRWHYQCLKPFADAVSPLVHAITHPINLWLKRSTGKAYSETAILITLFLGISFLRMIVSSFR